jgi:hypothetical protein
VDKHEANRGVLALDHKAVSVSSIERFDTFLELYRKDKKNWKSCAILHLDHIIRKLGANEVAYVLDTIEKEGIPVQVAYLQGATSLEGVNYDKLLAFLVRGMVWSVNLGEVCFTGSKLALLVEALKKSNVTHMFYELPHGELKDELRDVIRENRKTNLRWMLSNDYDQNEVIHAVNKNWFDPMGHTCNKEWEHAHGGALITEDKRKEILKEREKEEWQLPQNQQRIQYRLSDIFDEDDDSSLFRALQTVPPVLEPAPLLSPSSRSVAPCGSECGWVRGKVLPTHKSQKPMNNVMFDFGEKIAVKITPEGQGVCWRFDRPQPGDRIAYMLTYSPAVRKGGKAKGTNKGTNNLPPEQIYQTGRVVKNGQGLSNGKSKLGADWYVVKFDDDQKEIQVEMSLVNHTLCWRFETFSVEEMKQERLAIQQEEEQKEQKERTRREVMPNDVVFVRMADGGKAALATAAAVKAEGETVMPPPRPWVKLGGGMSKEEKKKKSMNSSKKKKKSK